jgi:nitroreductase
MDIIKALNWRYATKKFDPKRKLSAQQMKIIKEVIRLTPTSLGLQFMKIFIIKDQVIKDKLFPYSMNQIQIKSCSHLIVFTIPTKISDKLVDQHIALIKEIR